MTPGNIVKEQLIQANGSICLDSLREISNRKHACNMLPTRLRWRQMPGGKYNLFYSPFRKT